MNTPEPAREITVVVEKLLLIANSDQSVEEATLAQLEWQARKCLRLNPQEAYAALGMIATLRKDEEAMERAFQKSMMGNTRPDLIMAYAASLRRFFRLEEALRQALSVIEQGPGPSYVYALHTAVEWAHGIGRLHVAAKLLTLLRQQTTTEEIPERFLDLEKAFPPLIEAVNELNLTDEVLVRIQESAWAAIHERYRGQRLDVVTIADRILPYEGLSIRRTYWVPVTVEEGYALNDRMIELWAESDDPPSIDDFCPVIRGRGIK